MNYDIIESFTYNEFCENGLINKISDANQSLEIFRELLDSYLEIKEKRKEDRKCFNNEEILKLRQRRSQIEKIFGGTFITSTISENVPGQGIKISNKLIPFGEYRLFKERPYKKLLNSNPIIHNTFLNSLNSLYSFLKKAELEITILCPCQDSGINWKSRITFDIDYFDDYFELNFGDKFCSAFGRTKYNAFLLK